MNANTSIPLEYYAIPGSAGFFICKTQFEKASLNLLIDTGASVTILDKSRIMQLHPQLNMQECARNIQGLGWRIASAQQALIPEIIFAHRILRQIEVVLLDLHPINQKMAPWDMPRIDGLLGNDILLQMGAIINLPGMRIEFA